MTPRRREHRRFPPLVLVGTDHRASPLELRERVAYDPPAAEEALVHLIARDAVGEACMVSTCNRTEVYAVPREGASRVPGAAYRTAVDLVFLSRAPEMEGEGRLYVQRGEEAARHLLSVAAGLESMVLGEPEILGQVRQAHELAAAVGAAGPVLGRLLRTAADAGRRARAETEISQGAVSLGYAVAELARNIFSQLDETPTLVLGAGETARQVLRSLAERGGGRLQVANRDPERARRLAEEVGGVDVVLLADRLEAAVASDVVVAATSAAEPLLTREGLATVMGRRAGRPLLVVDLGVPRNVEPEAGRLGNVFLHSIDSLDTLIDRNLKTRREAVPRVEEIVEQELRRFGAWYRGLEAEPLVARLQQRAERIRRSELDAARGRFPAEVHDDLDRLTRALVRKILHHPSTGLRSQGDEGELARLDAARELFRLDEDDG